MVTRRSGRTRAIALAALLLAPGAPAAAQAGDPDPSIPGDFEYMGRDMLHVWSSPARADGGDVATAFIFLTGVGALTGFDEPVDAWIVANRDGPVLKVFDAFGESSPLNLFGRSKLLVPLSVTAWLAGLAFDEPDLRDAGLGCATSNVANTLARYSLSQLLGRPRPMTGRSSKEFMPLNFGHWEERSFPGGHAANAMACASFLAHRFDLGVGEPLIFGLASMVGLTRTVDRAHWLSDTAFGMGFGFSVGKEVARRQKERRGEGLPVLVVDLRIPF
jgi:membrane-associated phospholipid phosphatase